MEQGKTKHIYQNRHNNGCPLASILPRLVRPPTRRSGSGGGLSSGGRAGSILARGSRDITVRRQLAMPSRPSGIPAHIGGVPLTHLGSATQVRTWQHVPLLCWGESSACRLNSAGERGQPWDEEFPAGGAGHNNRS